jgi:multidrug efflux pump subunit AcrA (membrane-fusion protein)
MCPEKGFIVVFLCRFSSVWQSTGLLIRGPWVQAPQAAPHRQHVRQINFIAKHGSPSKGGKDYHMALKRADIRTILENPETSNDDKAKAILDALHKETDELKDQLDAEKTARTQAEKDRDAANGGKQAAEQALTDYKAQQTQKDTHAAKEAKFRELLKTAGVLDKYADRVVRLSGEDIDKLELDEKGNVKDAKKHTDSLKADWGDFVATTTTTGAKVDTPPTNTGSKMTKDQIFAIKDAGERQAAIAANADLFTGGGKE